MPAARASTDARGPAVGIVGAGQLARMTCEAASTLGIRTVVLAPNADDAAAAVAQDLVVGRPTDAAALRALAERCDVVTFDHEQVDLELLGALGRAGTAVRPGVDTLRMAVDKAEMRRRLEAAGLPVPAYEVLPTGAAPEETAAAIERFAADHPWPVVVKAARGGYDGKGVWPVHGAPSAREVSARAASAGIALLVEEHVRIDAELAVVVARGQDGATAAWPAVETAQVEGVCREVLYPGRVDPALAHAAAALARDVAALAGATGVLAVELFVTEGGLLVNEIAARPHNSAHWTLEGAVTSQFENHLRAVLGLPLGDTAPTAPHVASVNVLGGVADPASGLAAALAVRGAHVHLYGKGPRPGRKLGHVTVLGDDARDVRARAWAAAMALGTQVPASLPLAAR